MQVTAKGRSESTRARNVKRVGRATFSHDFILRVAVLFGQLWVIEEQNKDQKGSVEQSHSSYWQFSS